MKWNDMVSMCLNSLFKRKVRTLLTVAGVIIGTCAIVVMLSFGIGIKKSTDDMMQSMGDLTVIQIENYSPSPDAEPLDDSMLEKIRVLPGVQTLTPMFDVDSSAFQIRSGKYVYGGQVTGVYMDALSEFGYEMEAGKLPEGTVEEGSILFGHDALYNFYNSKKNSNNMVYPDPDASGKVPDPYVNPMKDKLELVLQKTDENNKKTVKPIKLKGLGVMAQDWNKNPSPGYSVFMDVKYARSLVSQYNKLNNIKVDKSKKFQYSSVVVKALDIKSVESVQDAIKALGFQTYSMDSMRESVEQQTRTIQMILGGLGAVSLLVAALGITNTMIMSIYERTREIGVMKVLGCVIGNIRAMFLIEAGMIGFIGGVVGLAFSYMLSFLLNTLAAGGGGFMGLGVSGQISIIPVWLALGALVFSTMVGLISGFSPANRAVKISALTAIRQE
ncbi:ABC transporter permease [Faecalispora anaeroviscerum]|uniref:ABC transporter permease n=1 Tax=Faecalispora anaeroviscerum TaxID=2991836 RepID=UPI0024BB5996|nr:ABC transporter permease [Faecalispora anaeroviscerum]